MFGAKLRDGTSVNTSDGGDIVSRMASIKEREDALGDSRGQRVHVVVCGFLGGINSTRGWVYTVSQKTVAMFDNFVFTCL